MTRDPKTISGNEFAATALALMEERKITSLAVIGADGNLEGIVHLHDLWGTEIV
jgi:arabinose-5-phosphate isomerase